MKKIILLSVLITLFSCSSGDAACPVTPEETGGEDRLGSTDRSSRAVYEELGLGDAGPAFEAFERAFDGYNSVGERRRDVLTVIDFTKPSTVRRLWVIDMEARRVLFNTWVAHGQGSGDNYATRFSNVGGSHQSSLGMYLTGSTYNGGNGYSLLLDGLEEGVNDRARERAIVVHGADYADPSVISSAGRLGRSWGCPALPREVTRPIIDAIKDGSILYIYGKSA